MSRTIEIMKQFDKSDLLSGIGQCFIYAVENNLLPVSKELLLDWESELLDKEIEKEINLSGFCGQDLETTLSEWIARSEHETFIELYEEKFE